MAASGEERDYNLAPRQYFDLERAINNYFWYDMVVAYSRLHLTKCKVRLHALLAVMLEL